MNGVDCLGRGSSPVYSLQCLPTGSDEHCQLLQTEVGLYCPTANHGKTIDVTATSQWASGDTSLAVIAEPGDVHTVGAGVVVVSIVPPSGSYWTQTAAFNVAPGTPPEQMVRLSVDICPQPCLSSRSAVGGTITVTPMRGSPQSCVAAPVTDSIVGACSFSVFGGTVAIHATDPTLTLVGDASVEATESGCFCAKADITLMPTSSGH